MLFNSKVKDIPAWSTWLVCGNLKYLVLTNYDVNYLCKVKAHKTPSGGYIGRPDFSISRTIWSFSNNNSKKAMRLDWQNNNFAAASRFFVNFLAIVAWLQCDSAYYFIFCWGRDHDNNFLFFSWTLILSFRIRSTPKKFDEME